MVVRFFISLYLSLMTETIESKTPVNDEDIKTLDQEIDQVFEELDSVNKELFDK